VILELAKFIRGGQTMVLQELAGLIQANRVGGRRGAALLSYAIQYRSVVTVHRSFSLMV
jgi:hypothetical protein